mmetsp:Transcript_49699/g.131406  ORF Transcript_49699/g.131406 Transcript_49699/m.131406 type:complete len:207 (+) Transcript_49699:96-716(+)
MFSKSETRRCRVSCRQLDTSLRVHLGEVHPAERAAPRALQPTLQAVRVEDVAVGRHARRIRDRLPVLEVVEADWASRRVATGISAVVKERGVKRDLGEPLDEVVGRRVAAPRHPDHTVADQAEHDGDEAGRHDDGDDRDNRVVDHDDAHGHPEVGAASLRLREHVPAGDRPDGRRREARASEKGDAARLHGPVADRAVAEEVADDL